MLDVGGENAGVLGYHEGLLLSHQGISRKERRATNVLPQSSVNRSSQRNVRCVAIKSWIVLWGERKRGLTALFKGSWASSARRKQRCLGDSAGNASPLCDFHSANSLYFFSNFFFFFFLIFGHATWLLGS